MKDNIKEIVADTLKAYPQSRNDDFLLISIIYGRYVDTGLSFEEVMTNHKLLGLPSFESIRRTRQKLQSEMPLVYGASGEMRKIRQKEYETYRNIFGVVGSWM